MNISISKTACGLHDHQHFRTNTRIGAFLTRALTVPYLHPELIGVIIRAFGLGFGLGLRSRMFRAPGQALTPTSPAAMSPPSRCASLWPWVRLQLKASVEDEAKVKVKAGFRRAGVMLVLGRGRPAPMPGIGLGLGVWSGLELRVQLNAEEDSI